MNATAQHTLAHDRRRQTLIGLALACAILGAWCILHVYAVFFYQWTAWSILTAPAIMAVLCWLYVGMFIVAHDCMHGSLAPGRPWLNRLVGTLCLGLYAGFDFRELNRKHHLHHRHAGTAEDPDFDDRAPHGFWRWLLRFMMQYMTLSQLVFFPLVLVLYMAVLGARVENMLAFWSLPAIASAVQLFTFGTYLPHKPGADPFHDRHRTRSSSYGWWLSLLTCFHFGYHHEHHDRPGTPWWRLPSQRRAILADVRRQRPA